MSDNAKNVMYGIVFALVILGFMAYGARDSTGDDWAAWFRIIIPCVLIFGFPLIITLVIVGIVKITDAGVTAVKKEPPKTTRTYKRRKKPL